MTVSYYHYASLAAVHRNALAESRKLKPDIPLRDEIEFEILLQQ